MTNFFSSSPLKYIYTQIFFFYDTSSVLLLEIIIIEDRI